MIKQHAPAFAVAAFLAASTATYFTDASAASLESSQTNVGFVDDDISPARPHKVKLHRPANTYVKAGRAKTNRTKTAKRENVETAHETPSPQAVATIDPPKNN